MKEIKNLDLINAAKAGDERAFTTLYSLYKKAVKFQMYKKRRIEMKYAHSLLFLSLLVLVAGCQKQEKKDSKKM